MKAKKHQLLTGGQIIINLLKQQGVKYIFGLIGSATMELFDGLYKNKKIKFIDVRDERTGTHIADGYARASGKAGIMIAGQNGPGVTNLVTGVAQAYKAFSPLITLAGDTALKQTGKDAFQEIDQQKLFKPITKKTFKINKINKLPNIINDSLKISLSPRYGPVHVNIPRDILSKKMYFKKVKKFKIIKLPSANNYKIEKVIKLLIKSNKAIIIAGGGIKNNDGQNEVTSLAKILKIPIISSAGHGDVISSDEKFYLGQMGPRGNKIATKKVYEAEIILALGTRLGFNSTFFSNEYINKKTKIIQVDIEKISLGRYFSIEIGICADAKTVAKQIIEKLIKKKYISKNNKWIENCINERKKYLIKRDKEANLSQKPIHPSGIFKILRETLPRNSAITLDAGTLCLQATDMLNYLKPRSLFTPLDFGLVGFSFACGLGVKLAKPNTHVISLMGDGGFGMTISEISTAVKFKINTITIIMNNKSWGAEKAYQRDYYNKRYIGTNIKSPPFHKVAKLYGANGYNITKLSQFEGILRKSLKSKKPVIINIEVNPKSIYSFRKDSFKHKLKV